MAHNHEVAGSSPAPATKNNYYDLCNRRFFVLPDIILIMYTPKIIKNSSLSPDMQNFLSVTLLVFSFIAFYLAIARFGGVFENLFAPTLIVIILAIVLRAGIIATLGFSLITIALTVPLSIYGALGHLDCGDNCGQDVTTIDRYVLLLRAAITLVILIFIIRSAQNRNNPAKKR